MEFLIWLLIGLSFAYALVRLYRMTLTEDELAEEFITGINPRTGKKGPLA